MTQQEELLVLRALVEKQKEELAEKDKIIAKQNIQIENMIQALLHAHKKYLAHLRKRRNRSRGSSFFLKKSKNWRKNLGLNRKRLQSNHIPVLQGNRGYGQKCLPVFPRKSKNISYRKVKPAANAAVI